MNLCEKIGQTHDEEGIWEWKNKIFIKEEGIKEMQ
jgi:hypothetical protein